jgi:Spy/CpxP family protein refolding chaperone
MNLKTCLAGCAAAILVGAGVMAIADSATTNPSPESHTSIRSRVIAPFNRLPDLTEDQKNSIREIHLQALEQERQIRQKETDDIMALLTVDQKNELTDMEARDAAAKKAGSAERRAKTEEERAHQLEQEAGTATQPSGAQ